MKFCLFAFSLVCFLSWSTAMLYLRDADNILKPDLLAVSSTVVPLPYYSAFGYEEKLLREKYKKRPEGQISLVTKKTN